MDDRELEQMIETYYNEIFAYCCRHVPDREQAQDLTQTAFLRLWQNRARYIHRGKLKNYLYTIAGNLCRDWYRSKKPLALDDIPEEPAFQEDRDIALAVRTALTALPFAQRDLVLLSFYQGFTVREIADVTHLPVPTVRYRLQKATQHLKDLLEEELQ